MTNKSNVALVLCAVTLLLVVSVSGVFIATTSNNSSDPSSFDESATDSIKLPVWTSQVAQQSMMSSMAFSEQEMSSTEMTTNVNEVTDSYLGKVVYIKNDGIDYKVYIIMKGTAPDTGVTSYLSTVWENRHDGSVNMYPQLLTLEMVDTLFLKAYKIVDADAKGSDADNVIPLKSNSLGAASEESNVTDTDDALGVSAEDPYIFRECRFNLHSAEYCFMVQMDVIQTGSSVKEYLCAYSRPDRMFSLKFTVLNVDQIDEVFAMSEGKIESREIVGKKLYLDPTSNDLVGKVFVVDTGKGGYTYTVSCLVGIEDSSTKLYFVDHKIVRSSESEWGFRFYTEYQLRELMSKADVKETNESSNSEKVKSSYILRSNSNAGNVSYVGKTIKVMTECECYKYYVIKEVTEAGSPTREYLCAYGYEDRFSKTYAVFTDDQLDELIAMSEGMADAREIEGKSLHEDETPNSYVGKTFNIDRNGSTYKYKVTAVMSVEDSSTKLYLVDYSNYGKSGGGFGFTYVTEYELNELMSKAI